MSDKRLTCALRVGDEVEHVPTGTRGVVRGIGGGTPFLVDWGLYMSGIQWRDHLKLVRRVETIEAEKQPKFKVGDRVRVVGTGVARAGRVGRVDCVQGAYGGHEARVCVDFGGIGTWYHLNCLTLLPSTLKPCPVCGGKARESSESKTKWWVLCDGECGMEGPTAATREGSIDAWDRMEYRGER